MKNKTVMMGDTECRVETLREWLNSRITSIRRGLRSSDIRDCESAFANFDARLNELLIIRDKINDGRIQEIG